MCTKKYHFLLDAKDSGTFSVPRVNMFTKSTCSHICLGGSECRSRYFLSVIQRIRMCNMTRLEEVRGSRAEF